MSLEAWDAIDGQTRSVEEISRRTVSSCHAGLVRRHVSRAEHRLALSPIRFDTYLPDGNYTIKPATY